MRGIVTAFVFCGTASLALAQAPPDDEQAYDEQAYDGQTTDDQAYNEAEVAPQPDQYADTDPSALTDFESMLSPYGQWVDDPTYGTVWMPSAGNDFVPYQTAGHWEYTGQDYVWVSDYPWGYIPFHYGRWVQTAYGWAWIPGRRYAPAWVDWRAGDDYVGWTPTPPDWGWYGGIAVGLDFIPYEPYWYVPAPYIFDEHVYHHVVYDDRFHDFEHHTHELGPVHHGGHGGYYDRGYVRGPDPRALNRMMTM